MGNRTLSQLFGGASEPTPPKPTFTYWTEQVRALFDQPEEYDLAAAIYSFAAAYEDDMSPQQAFNDFDDWVSA